MKFLLKEWKNGKELGILLFRLIIGFGLFYGHGMGKLIKLFSGAEIKFADPIGIGETFSFILITFAEGICSLLIMGGLLTRLATIPIIIGMLVIVFISHAGVPFGKNELALLYLVGTTALFFTGGGKYSIDRLFIK